MKKNNIKTSKKISLKPLLIATLSLTGVLTVGIAIFIGNNGFETVKRIYYGHVTRSAYHKEYKNLQIALEDLGINKDKRATSTCEISEIATDGINASRVLFCGIQTDNYVEITDANKPKLLAAAEQLDQLTNQNGGKLQTNIDTTFRKYIADIANGADYQPDFGATFVRDNYLCAVHMNVAYSNPNQPAYLIQFGCNSPRIIKDDIYLVPPINTYDQQAS